MIGGRLIKQWPIESQYPNLIIPLEWNSLRDFADWYLMSGKPICIPHNACVFSMDDATSVCLFRRGRFQVELYLNLPGYSIGQHKHPNMNVITMILGGGDTCGEMHPIFGVGMHQGRLMETLAGESHGNMTPNDHGGYVMLAFEEWLGDVTPTSAAVDWDGKTAGQKHDAVIEKYKTRGQDVSDNVGGGSAG